MTAPRLTVILSALGALLLGGLACKGGETAPTAPEPAAAAPADAPPRPPLAQDYEGLRAALANDDLAAAQAAATKLSAAEGASAGVVAGAKAIAAAPDIAAARLAFGDASKAYIEQLIADPKLAEGAHVFRCPMAKGYKKWVQLNDKLENPYMGHDMLECGSPSKLEL